MSNIAHLPIKRENSGNSTVAANVRAEIAYAGSTQGDLARAIGMTGMSLSRRLRDETEFTASEIVAVATHFGIEPGELFKRRNRPATTTKKASTPKGGGQVLPEMDSNHQPADVQPGHLATVTQLPSRALDAVERGELATIHTIRSA